MLDIILGLDKGWKDAFDADTLIQINQLSEKYTRRGIWGSGIANKIVGLLELKRKQQKKDEQRRRLIEGLTVLPGWIALVISLIAILVSIFF